MLPKDLLWWRWLLVFPVVWILGRIPFRLKTIGAEHVYRRYDRPVVILAGPHISYWDSLLLIAVLMKPWSPFFPTAWAVKPQVYAFFWGWLGRMLAWLGCFLAHSDEGSARSRTEPGKGWASGLRAIRALKDRPVAIFPEGAFNEVADEMGEWSELVGLMVARHKALVIPVGFRIEEVQRERGTLWRIPYLWRFPRATIVVSQPLDPCGEGLHDSVDITRYLRDHTIMLAHLAACH